MVLDKFQVYNKSNFDVIIAADQSFIWKRDVIPIVFSNEAVINLNYLLTINKLPFISSDEDLTRLEVFLLFFGNSRTSNYQFKCWYFELLNVDSSTLQSFLTPMVLERLPQTVSYFWTGITL